MSNNKNINKMRKPMYKMTYTEKVELALNENWTIEMCNRYGVDVKDVVRKGKESKELTTIEKVKIIEQLLQECNENARYKFNVRRRKQMYVGTKRYCLTISGSTHISILEDSIEKAINEWCKLGGSQMHHTQQHGIKMWF